MKKRIYFIHSRKIDYNELIYLPVLRSKALHNHELMLPENEDIKNGQSQIAGHCPFLLYCICTYCFCGGSSRNLNAEAAFRRCSSPTEA